MPPSIPTERKVSKQPWYSYIPEKPLSFILGTLISFIIFASALMWASPYCWKYQIEHFWNPLFWFCFLLNGFIVFSLERNNGW